MSNDLNKTELVALVCEYENLIDWLFAQLLVKPAVEVVEKPGRKEEVLALLVAHKKIAIPMIAKLVGISERNVSSQLSYLRKDGHLIGADSRGWKVYEGKK